MGEIRVGITSWTEPTLVEAGTFYPDTARTAEARLKYYTSQFNIVEADSTYYAMPNERTTGLWVTRTPSDFIFDIKAFRLFTQHQTPLTALPKDIRDAIPAKLVARDTLYYDDLPDELTDEMWNRFMRALLPLDSSGKLGVVVFQFPPWFVAGGRERDHIVKCREKLRQYRIAVEFRNASWTDSCNGSMTFGFLQEHDLPYVCCDEPQSGKLPVPLLFDGTSDIGVFRLHGRNHETWDEPGLTTAERFSYLYSQDELLNFIPGIEKLASKMRSFHVLFNNCHGDKAVQNARQMRGLLGLKAKFDYVPQPKLL